MHFPGQSKVLKNGRKNVFLSAKASKMRGKKFYFKKKGSQFFREVFQDWPGFPVRILKSQYFFLVLAPKDLPPRKILDFSVLGYSFCTYTVSQSVSESGHTHLYIYIEKIVIWRLRTQLWRRLRYSFKTLDSFYNINHTLEKKSRLFPVKALWKNRNFLPPHRFSGRTLYLKKIHVRACDANLRKKKKNVSFAGKIVFPGETLVKAQKSSGWISANAISWRKMLLIRRAFAKRKKYFNKTDRSNLYSNKKRRDKGLNHS